MNWEETVGELRNTKRALERAYSEVEEEVKFIEERLTTEYDRAMNREYGRICRVLGILEEQIRLINNQINKLK